MYKLIINIAILSLFISLNFTEALENYNKKLGERLVSIINYKSPEEKILVWIYFNDKGNNPDALIHAPGVYLTERCIERRIKRIEGKNIVDEKDLPVHFEYVNEIQSCGVIIRHKSKWFNAVSCLANKSQIEVLSSKSFVSNIELVSKYYKPGEYAESFTFENFQYNLNDNPSVINYGSSLNQSAMINVPQVHDMGYTGQGILIALFDAGVDNLNHNCFNLLRSKGLRTYDFVNGDTIIADGQGRLGSGAHGTLTLSLVGGYDPGWLVSPAFGSQFIIAKTENTESETPVEEDNWIAAAEWADSLGADIISSSLGYLRFDPPYKSYTWQSMDGNTTLITRAADIASEKGIVVVSSVGNEGEQNFPNTLKAPADGDYVIAVGATFLTKRRVSFSSYGPTFDGRIKPDVMALGVGNYTARPGAGSAGYLYSSGTSMSCPMVAGVCALMLSANSSMTPAQVRDILRSTADSSLTPNNFRGWGTVNAYSALNNVLNLNMPSDYILEQNFPNPFNPSTTFRFNLKKNAIISIVIYDITGAQQLKILDDVFYTAGKKEMKFDFGSAGLSSGVYFFSLFANKNAVDSRKMIFVK